MILVCSECFAPLALDQRYCIECGVRARALPAHGPWGVGAARTAPAAAPAPAPSGGWFSWPVAWLPTPRVAGVAVMGMLAFGAELGAAVGANPPAGRPATIIYNRPASQPTPAAAAPVNAVQTETITTGGSTPSGGGAGSGSSGSGGTSGGGAAATTPTTATATTPTGPTTNAYGLPQIQHVFLIMLGNVGFSQTFNSQDPYLGRTLPKQGKLIQFYYGVTGGELANEIALFSGQGPTDQTASNCPTYSAFAATGTGRHAQTLGSGCVYPAKTLTLTSQLTAAHLTWKAYIQGEANGLPGQAQSCVHPALGQADPNQAPSTTGTYVTWRNPFVYFRAITGQRSCGKEDADFSQLSTDLTTAPSTPNLSVIIPNTCDDGSAQPCQPGGTGGVTPADSFLKSTLTEIESSPAYQAGGLIIITGDEAPQSGPNADPSACCSTPTYPNLSSPPPATGTSTTTGTTPAAPTSASGTTSTAPAASSTSSTTTTSATTTAPATTSSSTTTTSTTSTTPSLGSGETTPTGGGGQVGLLLISPWVKKNTIDPLDYYNHYSLLKSLEEIFGIKQRLGYAGVPNLTAFDASTFDGNGPAGG